MNTELLVGGGGVFSKFIIAVENLHEIGVHEDYYLKCIDERAINVDGENPFYYILEEPEWYGMPVLDPNFFQRISAKVYPSFDMNHQIENSDKFLQMSNIAKAMKLNAEMKSLINEHSHLVSDSIPSVGVHIRATDMLYAHKRLGTWDFMHYDAMLKYTLSIMKRDGIDDVNIFVASDNQESIDEIVENFGTKYKVSFLPNLSNRVRGWGEDSSAFHLQNFTQRRYWQDSFLEMYMLSLCDNLLIRASNLNNFSRLYYSKNRKQNVIWLPWKNDPIWYRNIFPLILPERIMTPEEKELEDKMRRRSEFLASQDRANALRENLRRKNAEKGK